MEEKSAQEQLAEIELAKIRAAEAKAAKKLEQQKKFMKYGCLPIILIFIFFFFVMKWSRNYDSDQKESKPLYEIEDVVVTHTGKVFNPKTDVNEFCTKSLTFLTKKYGKPESYKFEIGNDYHWVLNKEKGLKAMVLYNKKGRKEVVRFSNLKVGMFPFDFGWDDNTAQTHMNEKIGYITIEGLQGIKKAKYNYNTQMLRHVLEVKLSGKYKQFGKRLKTD